MKKIDVRGLSCPEPVLQLQAALVDKPQEVELLADCSAARDNVRNYAEEHGYTCEIEDLEDGWRFLVKKK